MKKISYVVLAISILFSYTSVFAYDYYNDKNESSVKDRKNEIYDRKEMYEYLAGEKEEEEILEYTNSSSDKMWWPIGSKTAAKSNGKLFAAGDPAVPSSKNNITSYFGGRLDPITGNYVNQHGAIDISASGILGTYVIASRDGVIVQAGSCGSSSYGNCVLIDHGDGLQTRYAHMLDGSIIIKKGETVKQGQVIGQVGSTGRSTGPHLHFEVILSGERVDPLLYLDLNNPRPTGDFMKMLESAEGATYCDAEKKYYKVEDLGDAGGICTVGYGVLLQSGNVKKIGEFGGDTSKIHDGDCQPVEIIDKVKEAEASEKRSYIQSNMKKNGITLTKQQEDALVIFMYQWGNIDGFATAYKETSVDPQSLWKKYFNEKNNKSFYCGVKRRRCSEWKLYYNGVYSTNIYDSNACSGLNTLDSDGYSIEKNC